MNTNHNIDHDACLLTKEESLQSVARQTILPESDVRCEHYATTI